MAYHAKLDSCASHSVNVHKGQI